MHNTNPFQAPSSPLYGFWGAFLFFVIVHFLWSQFASYPSGFERQLRRGKSWVYIPMRWKGLQKFVMMSLTRLLILCVAGSGAILLVFLTGKFGPAWIAGFAIILFLAANRLDILWTHLRYRQQEDAYYRLHDELRHKLDQEGKDYTEAQFRNLAAYQHQQQLRKADEAGEFLKALRASAKRARKTPGPLQLAED
ncbi:MAG TPA: hypothetical protein DCQ83_06515 [Fibrobacteres bacterium]|jgi:hypothetical protein|nr:hypothetical protein [Fibrobacterota bacterium]